MPTNNETTLKIIGKIITILESNPNQKITSTVGSGCHARPYGDKSDKSYKIIIPGDNFDMVKSQLHYLLYDIGIDCGLSDSELAELDNIFLK
jgi:hypothetical protein